MQVTASSAATGSDILAEGVILCVRLGSAAPLLEACRAAARGGLRALEITLTTPGALQAISELSRDPGLIVGAGTVLSVDDARRVADAGGRFALSPVFDPEVVDAIESLGLFAVPGAATPTEILAAHRHGAQLVKVFPAGALGGPAYLRAIRGPLPQVPLAATSGPDSLNMADYFAAGISVAGVGAEVFGPGWTLLSVEGAARRVKAAVAAAMAGA